MPKPAKYFCFFCGETLRKNARTKLLKCKKHGFVEMTDTTYEENHTLTVTLKLILP